MTTINDLDLRKEHWKQYKNDITTEALWISSDHDKYTIPDRGYKNDSNFHGLYIHEIPYQMIQRYTKKGETVWDCFGGSGTTLEVCKDLERECIINDLNPTLPEIQQGDSCTFNPGKPVQLVMMHPPYFNIVKFSEDAGDLSHVSSLEQFYDMFKGVVANVDKYLEPKRYLVLVCGHIYWEGEDISLGDECKNIIRSFGYKCKGTLVKDYGFTKNKAANRENLKYYRHLKFGLWKLTYDNIFILQKGG